MSLKFKKLQGNNLIFVIFVQILCFLSFGNFWTKNLIEIQTKTNFSLITTLFQDFWLRKMLSREQKLLLSQLVLYKKNILFGPLSPGVTNKTRTQNWEEITNELIANGASATTNHSYMRHTEWGNLQRSVVEKYKKHLRSGAEGITAIMLFNFEYFLHWQFFCLFRKIAKRC